MGIFDFFKKDKGKELFKENDAAEAKAAAIRAEIARLGLQGQISVVVDGERVKITGQVPDLATKEKLMLVAGNVKGVREVQEEIAAEKAEAAEAAATKFYTVESGDTLSKVAKEFYGDANKYMKIVEANQPMITDPDMIYPGQVLRIPPLTTAAA